MAKNDSKVIYWLKFDVNFFKRDSVKFILKSKNGAQAIVLYGQLACISSGNNGILNFNDKRPYTVDEIAALVEMKEKQVKPLLELLQQYDLIEYLEDKSLCLPEVANKLTSETGKSQRMKDYRNRIKEAAKIDNLREEEAFRTDEYINKAYELIDQVNLSENVKEKANSLSEPALREIYSVARSLINDGGISEHATVANKDGYLATCIRGIIERETA